MFVSGKLHLFPTRLFPPNWRMSSVGQRSAGSSSRLPSALTSDSKACKKRKLFFICLTGVFISRFHTTWLHTPLCEHQLTLKAEVKVSACSEQIQHYNHFLYKNRESNTGEEPLSCLQDFQLSCCMRTGEITITSFFTFDSAWRSHLDEQRCCIY